MHFGLPANTPVDSLHIQWPDGKTQRWAVALSSTQLALAYAPDGTVLEDKTEATPFQLSVLRLSMKTTTTSIMNARV